MHGITAVQVRRDLMLIGFSSDTKKGYDVGVLIEFIGTILDSPDGLNVGIIGMGNLAQAVTHYFNGKRSRLRITAAFDIDPRKVGRTVAGVPCYHMDTFAQEVPRHDIRVIILTSPSSVAAGMVGPITDAGIRGVLNFTSTPLTFPDNIYVEDYDIITLLEKVAYFSKDPRTRRGLRITPPHADTLRIRQFAAPAADGRRRGVVRRRTPRAPAADRPAQRNRA